MNKTSYSDLPIKIYKKIYAPPKVDEELSPSIKAKCPTWAKVDVRRLTGKEEKRFARLVRRWSRKLKHNHEADVQVLVLYREFVDADEVLFANKEAEVKFSPYANVRDVYKLYELAEKEDIFNRADSLAFLDELIKLNYRTSSVQKEKRKLSRR